jgi:hypothetical protein
MTLLYQVGSIYDWVTLAWLKAQGKDLLQYENSLGYWSGRFALAGCFGSLVLPSIFL